MPRGSGVRRPLGGVRVARASDALRWFLRDQAGAKAALLVLGRGLLRRPRELQVVLCLHRPHRRWLLHPLRVPLSLQPRLRRGVSYMQLALAGARLWGFQDTQYQAAEVIRRIRQKVRNHLHAPFSHIRRLIGVPFKINHLENSAFAGIIQIKNRLF